MVVAALVFASCSTTKNSQLPTQVINLDTIAVNSNQEEAPYRSTPEKLWDLLHTELDLKFDLENEEVIGKATISLKPHFYVQNSLALDAKFMQINSVETDNGKPLSFKHNSNKLFISLPKPFTKIDTLSILVNYIAKPRTNSLAGGRAITAAKGVYFINSHGKVKGKPTQIWTQGETDFASCWFPTLDEPNQKSSQQVRLTVQEKFATLSNGEFQFSTLNGDGTRTDYWAQEKAHSPYLFMMAIGEFNITTDSTTERTVSYYLEDEYKDEAYTIFGNTPEMIEFYSKILGVDYPWEKYSQVVVRDYVSGAMENTSATIHGEFVQNHKRELLDYNPDDIIAHELFHQWFGDLVSCESWSNLPLNEAFATYGEYLWYEHKYSADEAAFKLDQNLGSYLRESNYKQEDWVRFHYKAKDNMFDAHSYSKGARILHMLRYTVGDEAFFESLKLYLNRYANSSAEMHQLRLCFEEVTGQDLNWFFNQWAFAKGHPELLIDHSYDSSFQEYTLSIQQVQENEIEYRLPIELGIYSQSGLKIVKTEIDSKNWTYKIKGREPILVNVDVKKYLLCEKAENLTINQLEFKYKNAKSLTDRQEVIKALIETESWTSQHVDLFDACFSDPHFSIRKLAMDNAGRLEQFVDKEKLDRTVEGLATLDPNPRVRKASLVRMYNLNNSTARDRIVRAQLNDSSYAVIANALYYLSNIDSAAALVEAKKLENEPSKKLRLEILELYANYGTSENFDWLNSQEPNFTMYSKVSYVRFYLSYLNRIAEPKIYNKGIEQLKYIWDVSNSKKVKLEVNLGLEKIEGSIKEKLESNPNQEELEFTLDYLNTVRQSIKVP